MSEESTARAPIPTRPTTGRLGVSAILPRLARRLGLEVTLVRDALIIFALSRLGFILLTFLTLLALPVLHHQGSIPTFTAAWARFDATYYARLARDGYQRQLFYRAAFFPLQPLATRLIIPLTGGNFYLAGMVVSNIAFFFALLGIAALAGEWFDVPTARRTMVYVTLFPTSLFLFAGYAEALFLALATWCVIAAHRGRWWQAGLLGLLATLTRQMGLFLLLPFAFEYTAHVGWRLRALRPSALWGLLIPLGLVLFMGWLWLTVGDPLAFVHAEKTWSHVFLPPWATLWQALGSLLHIRERVFLLRALIDFAAVLLFAVLLVLGARHLRAGNTLYSAAVWLLAVSYPTLGWLLQSDARYMLAAFPGFAVLAWEGRRPWLNALIVAGCGILLALMTHYFVRGEVIL
jgi:hypothetical protein